MGVYSRPGAHELFLRLGWAVIRAGHLFYSNKYGMPLMLLCNVYGVVITLQALPMPNPSSKSYSLV